MSNNQRKSHAAAYQPRRFDREVREQCWERASKMEGRNPDRWRLDAVGNPVLKALNNCRGPICYQFDHIVPFSKGGETTVENCQLLQSFVNIFKSNKEHLSKEELQRISPKVQLTPEQLDIIEYSIYG